MEKGTKIYTPRFCTVRISEIYPSRKEAEKNGYREPTYWEDPSGEYGISGRSLDLYHMEFAAYRL